MVRSRKGGAVSNAVRDQVDFLRRASRQNAWGIKVSKHQLLLIPPLFSRATFLQALSGCIVHDLLSRRPVFFLGVTDAPSHGYHSEEKFSFVLFCSPSFGEREYGAVWSCFENSPRLWRPGPMAPSSRLREANVMLGTCSRLVTSLVQA